MIADIIGIVMHFLFLSFSILVVCLHFFSCFFTFLLPLYILIIFPFCFYCSVFCTMRKSTNLRNWQFLGQSKLNNSNVLLCILMGFSALGGVEGVAKWWDDFMKKSSYWVKLMTKGYTLDAFFRQIKSFRRFCLAFGFGLQTFYLIDFS